MNPDNGCRNGRRSADLSLWKAVVTCLVTLLLLWSPAGCNDLSSLMDMEEYIPKNDPAAPYGTVWYNGSYLYMPAPPGNNPSCARGGMTYCDTINTYPGEVIEKLLIRWKYDLSTVFSSENRDTLTSGLARNTSQPWPRKSDGHSRRHHSYGRGWPSRQPAFRPIQGHYGPPISFEAAVTSDVGSTNPGFVVQPGVSGVTYSVPSTRQLPPRQQPGYSFAVPRQKRQADSGGQLCPTTGQFVSPRAGLNNRGEWRFVVNMGDLDDQYTQLVRSERCISTQCSGLCTIPAGMTATCQQQYVQKKMVGLDPSGSEVYTDLYWIPHCCVCQIR
ncbi:protein spaetzle 5-like isoform X2 [Pollicipes pollicipes]|uniref:protein spaetzle 5-like isoform X2 n=1 Tax=Pollicipes pollicipes TaxID=41117 RepID=UPI0018859DA9|nr:protein spaetzle 5-like isoform X2 [Pollicipes pollicipes]